MRDEIDGRLWAQHHESLSGNLSALLQSARQVLRKIHEVEFDAPWNKQSHDGCG